MIKRIFIFLLPKRSNVFFCLLLIEVLSSLKARLEPSTLFASFSYFVLALTRCYWRFIAKNFTSLELQPYCVSMGKPEFSDLCTWFWNSCICKTNLKMCKRHKMWQVPYTMNLCWRQDLNQNSFFVNSFIACLNSHYVFLDFCSIDVPSSVSLAPSL